MAWAYVQSGEAQGSGSTSTITFGANTTTGNKLIFLVEAANTTNSTSFTYASGSKSLSPTFIDSITNAGGGGFRQELWYFDVNGPYNDFGAGDSGGAYVRLIIVEYSGLATGGPTDYGEASGSGGGANCTTSVTYNDSLVVGGGFNLSTITAVGSGYTMRQDTDTYLWLEDKNSAATGSLTVDFTSSGKDAWTSQGAVFREPALAKTPSFQQLTMLKMGKM